MRSGPVALWRVLLLLVLAGCGTARTGPNTSAILEPEPGAANYDLLHLSVSNIAPFLPTARAQPAVSSGRQASRAPALALAPGDVLRVTIYERSDGGLFAPMTTGGSVFQGVRVDDAGMVSLPYAGRLRVGGMRLSQVSASVKAALAGKAVDPEVHVELVANPSHAVLVAGEVKTPGLVTTADSALSATEAIARSGGPSLPAHLVNVAIRSGRSVRRLPYLQLLSDPAIYLQRGDQVVVEATKAQFVAMGALTKPGLQDMAKPGMTLLEGMAQAGGLNDNAANPRGVFVFRIRQAEIRQAEPRPLVVHLDFSRADSVFLARQFALLPDDAVYVTNAPVYEFQKVIAPLVQALIIGRSSAALAN